METQWILAFVLPLLRLINTKVHELLIKKACADDKSLTNIYVSITINANYALFIAVSIGSLATQLTSYLILSVEVLLNLYECYKIIKLGRRIEAESSLHNELKEERKQAILTLVSIEILETMVPIIYAITFLIAYYGPNASILGGIQNSYWQFEAVENITPVLESVSKMILIDLSGSILIGALLWKYSAINLLKESCKVMKTYFSLFALKVGIILARVNT